MKLDTRALYAYATWKSADGLVHSVGPWGVRCGAAFRRLPRPANEPRTVDCLRCLAQQVVDDADETDSESEE